MNRYSSGSLLNLTAIMAAVSLSFASECNGDLLLHYTFDDQSDPTLNTGTLGTTFNGDLQGNAAFAQFGGGFALSLDGDVSDNSVVIPLGNESAFDIGDSDFSLFARFQTTYSDPSSSAVRSLIWKQNVGSNPNYSLSIFNDTGFAQLALADGSQYITLVSNVALNDGATHTLLGVRHGNQLGLFVDGALETTMAIPDGFGSTNNNNALVIGGRTLSNNDDWVGLIDEIQVHDSAVANIPEPATYLLAGLASLAGICRCRRRIS